MPPSITMMCHKLPVSLECGDHVCGLESVLVLELSEVPRQPDLPLSTGKFSVNSLVSV